MVQNGLLVNYDLNGGAATSNLTAHAKLTHAPGDTVMLWQPDDEADDESTGINDGHWTKSAALGNAVFVGWSTVDCGAEPFYD